jgi:hypothetical protein
MDRQTIPAEIDRRVRATAGNRCGYCLSPQHLVMARLEAIRLLKLTLRLALKAHYSALACMPGQSISNG